MKREYSIRIKVIMIAIFSMALFACSGGGGGSTGNSGNTSGAPSVLTKVYSAVSTTICPDGGIQVDAGIDVNLNGVLDPVEINSTQYVCNGSNGASGQTTLVSIVSEPSGSNCPSGGSKVNVGLDADLDGILHVSEITSFSYVCNGMNGSNGTNGTDGSNGTNGTNGTNGYNSLVSIVTEPSGTNCPTGGVKVSSGLDSNDSDSLDAAEVTATNYVCNGIPGDLTLPAFPTNVTVVAASWNRIDISWDPATDNSWVLGYKIYRNGQYRMFTGLLNASDLGLSSNTEYCYRISAVDLSGNESPLSGQACAATLLNDVVDGYYTNEYDVNGNKSRQTFYSGPGPDSILFTADDDISSYATFSYDANGNVTRQSIIYDAGVDKIWYTYDDLIYGYYSYIYTAATLTRQTGYSSRGADNTWYTADDFVASYYTFEYDVNGNLERRINNTKGNDGLPFTADDVVSGYIKNVYDNGILIQQINYYQRGTDGNWFTDDDVILYYVTPMYDIGGNKVKDVKYGGPGADGVWFTVDDPVSEYYSYILDENGRTIKEIYYPAPGTDSVWFNKVRQAQ